MVGAEGAKFHLTYPTRENFLFSSKIRISKNGPNFTGKHRNLPRTTQYSPRNDLRSPERTKRSFSESRFFDFFAYSAQNSSWLDHFPCEHTHKKWNLGSSKHGHLPRIFFRSRKLLSQTSSRPSNSLASVIIYIYLYIQCNLFFWGRLCDLAPIEKRLRRDYLLT